MECINSTLSKIPVLESTTQVLDLSFNNLLRIDENVLRERNLYNLQKIYLRHCSIQVVIGRCFEGITNLVELDLSYNLLQIIPKVTRITLMIAMMMMITMMMMMIRRR